MKNEKLIDEWRKATGWSIEKVNKELTKLKCCYWDALKVYMRSGRMPTNNEQELLNRHGVYGWEFSRSFTIHYL